MNDVTRILSAIEAGDSNASEDLLPIVYKELRNLAAAKLGREQPGQTLQATALVHDAYVRLVDVRRAQKWNSRGHFFAAAAEAMRRILIERARRKATSKAGGHLKQQQLFDVAGVKDESKLDLIALDEALQELERKDPRRASVVKLRFFAGLSNRQAAEALSIAPSTADADWAYARCWLRLQLSGESPEKDPSKRN